MTEDEETAFQNLGEFISELEKAGELLRINAPVSCDLEIIAHHRPGVQSPRRRQGAAFRTRRRIALSGPDQRFWKRTPYLHGPGDRHPWTALAERLDRLCAMEPPKSLRDNWRNFFLWAWICCASCPARPRTPPARKSYYRGDEIDLSMLPVLKCWPQDGGPFVTLPVVITRSSKRAGATPVCTASRFSTGTQRGCTGTYIRTGRIISRNTGKAGKRMPVAVAIGTDPAVTYAATAPLPQGNRRDDACGLYPEKTRHDDPLCLGGPGSPG